MAAISSAKLFSDGTKSFTSARPRSVAFLLRLKNSLLSFSASSACAVVTVALSWPLSARSLSRGATSFRLLPNSSWVSRALLASSAKPDRATATFWKASAGSRALRSFTLRPMALMAFSVSLPGLAALRPWLSLTRAVLTVSKLAPLRRATSSRALMFSMLAPVASLRSFMASRPSTMALVIATKPPTLMPMPIPAKAPATLAADVCMLARLRPTLSKALLVLSCAVSLMPMSAIARSLYVLEASRSARASRVACSAARMPL